MGTTLPLRLSLASLLLLAQLTAGDSANALWMYAFMMAMGWIVIGISLHARGVVVAREAAKEEAEA